MNNDRYATLIALKCALDNAYKKRDPLSVMVQEYDRTLSKAKIAGFKVMRNSAGEHKLIDKLEHNSKLANVFETMASAVD